MLLGDKKEITYNNGDSIVKDVKFRYDSKYPIIVNQVENGSHGDSLTTVYTYPFHVAGQYYPPAPVEGSLIGSRVISNTLAANCINMNSLGYLNSPVEILTYRNKSVIDGKLFYYGMHGTSDYLPDSIYTIESSIPLSTFCRYSNPQNTIDGRYGKSPSLSYRYDSKSNIIQLIGKDRLATTYLWSYNGQYPVAEIKNSTYDQVKTVLGETYINNLSSNLNPTADNLKNLSDLRYSTLLPNIQVTSYTYKPLIGLATKTDSRGVVTNYTYDIFNRLYLVQDNIGNILSKYSYGYRYCGGWYDVPNATVTPGFSSYTPGASGIGRLSSVTGGSGNYTYSWYLKNSSGTVLASNLNTTSTSFSFTCSQVGIMTIQCEITDNISGLKGVVTGYTTVKYSCSFTMKSGFTNISNSISCDDYTSTYSISFRSSSVMKSGWNYLVATICTNCRPTTVVKSTYVVNGKTWQITFDPNGNVYFSLSSSYDLPANTAVAFGTYTFSKQPIL